MRSASAENRTGRLDIRAGKTNCIILPPGPTSSGPYDSSNTQRGFKEEGKPAAVLGFNPKSEQQANVASSLGLSLKDALTRCRLGIATNYLSYVIQGRDM